MVVILGRHGSAPPPPFAPLQSPITIFTSHQSLQCFESLGGQEVSPWLLQPWEG